MSDANGSEVRKIVVGVDGSPSSVAALRWAISEAERTGDSVEAVIAWQYPMAPTGAFGWTPGAIDDGIDMQGAADKTLTEVIDEVVRPGGPVTVQRRVAEGYASSVLVAASAHADLLVVGNRGHGTFTEALIGSVSQNCVHHAKCPVVIVRARD